MVGKITKKRNLQNMLDKIIDTKWLKYNNGRVNIETKQIFEQNE